ncbi:hypothetical protein LMG23992_05189 [Cupriavidus laharis]|uniref:DUF1840 domain-containing protein n=2 Tax=Cupriavidus laharis TaxID=151654 RepID=A0ABN7ZFS5_9BURK|nr:hypothetical protein LMG23992_05189 [Cupriavidus laharis]
MRATRKSHNPRGHSRPREPAFRMSVKGNNIMLITFKSHAAQDLIMMRDLAMTLLGIIGKHLGERGVITTEELPRAIQKLEAAVSDAKRNHPAETAVNDGKHEEDDEEPLHLGQRAYPFLDMLRASQREGVDVLWGV